MRPYIHPSRILAMFGALFGTSNPGAATQEQMNQAISAIRIENVNSNPNRGVGPWVTRSAGWRQKQRRKLARRTA